MNADLKNWILQIYSADTRPAVGEITDYTKPKATPENTATDNVLLAVNANGTRAIKKTERSATLGDAKTGQPVKPPFQ